jgi:hypothetical protein
MDVVGLVLFVALAIGGFGVLVGFAIRVGGRDLAERDDDVARRRRELDAAAGRRRLTTARAFLPNDGGHDGDAA